MNKKVVLGVLGVATAGAIGYLYLKSKKETTQPLIGTATVSPPTTTSTTTPPPTNISTHSSTTTQPTTTTTTTSTTTLGYTVTIVNSCYPIITADFQSPVLVNYIAIDGTQKSIMVDPNQQVSIQVYPNSVIDIYALEISATPVFGIGRGAPIASSGGSGIMPFYVTAGGEATWKLLQRITVTSDITLNVCQGTVMQSNESGGNSGIMPLATIA